MQTPLSRQSWEVGEILFNQARTVAFVLAILCTVLLYAFFARTTLGKALRAAADNPIAAAYMGIDVDRWHRMAFGLGVGITAVAGGLIASTQSFQPYIGFDFVIVMYAGVVLGGLGSILGAFWGGMTIGLVQQMSTLVLPYQLQNTAIFVVFLLIVFFRPQRHVRPRRRAHLMASRNATAHYVAIALFAGGYLLLGLLVRNSYYQLIMTLVLLWASMGLAWNMLSGYSGLISFGHAAFFGLGAYTMTIVFVTFGITPWLGIPIGVVVGVLAGIVIGLATFRLRGHYFALAMLAYPLAMLYVFEWLGYQEVTLPMKRADPALYAVLRPARLHGARAGADGRVHAGLVARRALALRHVAARHQAERTGGRGCRHRHARVEDARHDAQRRDGRRCRRLLRGGAAGGHAADRVRHAGVGAGAGRLLVRRRRRGVGAGDRVGDPGAARRDAARRAWPHRPRHPGRGVRGRHHRDHLVRARGHLLARSRPAGGAVARARAHRSCRVRRRRRALRPRANTAQRLNRCSR